MLVPNLSRPWPKLRTFRRGVMYGTQRELILKRGVLRDKELPGAKLMSGPFPAPIDPNDLLSYAYDEAIRPYEQ